MQLVEGMTLRSCIDLLRERESQATISTAQTEGKPETPRVDATTAVPATAPIRRQIGVEISAPLYDFKLPTAQSDEHWQLAAEIAKQVAEALAHAHRAEVVHRDIKPSNVLLDKTGKPWVTDFGLAKVSGIDLTQTGVGLGTLRYMAPEQLRGEATGRSDIYSLGVLLSELVTLERPKELEIDKVPSFPSRVWRPVPQQLQSIAKRCTAPLPADRYRCVSDVAEDLGRFLQKQPVMARAPNSLERIWWWVKQHKLASIAMVAALLFACVAIPQTVARFSEPRTVKVNGFTLYPDGIDREVAEWVLERGTVSILSGKGLKLVDPWSEDETSLRELPDELFNLRAIHLRECNDVDEAFIRRVAELPRLQVFHLDHCRFEESWTKHLPKARELEYLNLYGCNLSDSAMVDLSKINLAYLGLTDNDISDDGIALLQQTSLGELKLVNNPRITDAVFSSLGKIGKLALVDITNTAVSNEAARAFESKMQSRVGESAVVLGPVDERPIVLNGYEIYTHGPDREIANWVLDQRGRVWLVCEHGPQVVQRNIDDPVVKSELPDGPFHLKDIELAEVQTITKEIVSKFPKIPRLETVVLKGSNFDKNWTRYLAQCKRLRYLNLNSCGISDDQLDDLARISLTYLGLNNNAVTDSGVGLLTRNRELNELTLANTDITDQVFDSLAKIPALDTVDVQGTGVTQDAAEKFEERLRKIVDSSARVEWGENP